MKAVSSQLAAHFSEGCTTLAVLWLLTRKDGWQGGFTTHDQSIVYPPSVAGSVSSSINIVEEMSGSNGGATDTLVVPIPTNIALGDTVLFAFRFDRSPLAFPVDALNNDVNFVAQEDDVADGTAWQVWELVCSNPMHAGADSITIQYSAAHTGPLDMVAFHFNGNTGSTDHSASAQTAASSFSSAPITTTSDHESLFGFASGILPSTDIPVNADNWTPTVSTPGLRMSYAIGGPAGPQQSDWTQNSLAEAAAFVVSYPTTVEVTPSFTGITYQANTGLTTTAVAKKSDASVDNVEVSAFLDHESISEDDARAGLFDYATIEVRIVNWADLSQGDLKVLNGTLGELKLINGVCTAEIRGLTQQLTTTIGQLYGPLCRAELGSGPQVTGSTGNRDALDPTNRYLCHINLDLFRQTSSVVSSVDAVTIVPAGGLTMRGHAITPTETAPSGWFNDGILIFTSGAMKGIAIDLKGWDGSTLTTFLPMPFQPLPGDTFTIEPGCDKKSSTCFSKFNNIINLRGEPFIPGNDLILLYPNARS